MLKTVLDSTLRNSLRSIGLPTDGAEFTRTKSLDHGHFQTNIAMRLAKGLGENPRDLAARIATALGPEVQGKLEVAGPGFINLCLTADYLQEAAVWILFWEEGMGVRNFEAGKDILIDFSSPNIAKRMHVGHLRSTVIGNALANIHEALGARVVRDNHVGDFGTPFGKLLVAWDHWADLDAYQKDPVGELQRLYEKFGQVDTENPDFHLMEDARSATLALQVRKDEEFRLWTDFTVKSMEEFQLVYDRLGVPFTRVRPESFYQFRMEDDCQMLWDAGVIELDDDAFIARWERDEGDSEVVVLRKKDGAATYMMSEISAYFDRVQEGFNRILVVTDNRQSQHFSQVQRIVDNYYDRWAEYTPWATGLAGERNAFVFERTVPNEEPSSHPKIEHIPFGVLRIDAPDGKELMSSRSGGAINLLDVLEEAKRRSRAILDEAGTIPEEERDFLSDKIGVGAIIYSDLRQNPASDITFNWDTSLAMTGNTAPYLMYTHARACSVLRKAGVQDMRKYRRDALLTFEAEPQAETLLLLAAQFSETIWVAGRENKPSVIANHLFQVAQAFGTFWAECPILVEDAALFRRRVLVAALVKEVMARGLALLGIYAPEAM